MFVFARILMAALFLGGAAQKWSDPAPVRDLLALAGLPPVLVWPALVFNLVAGVGLLFGPGLRIWALLLAAYCGVTSLFHLLLLPDPWQMTIFVKNWAIAGGLLAVAEVDRLRHLPVQARP